MNRSRAATRDVYDRIAAHFAETRQYPWPEVTEFLEAAPSGSVGLDVGCGNGRHLPALDERVDRPIGLDISTELLAIANERTDVEADLLAGDAATLPIASDAITVAISIATLHHLPTRALRVRSLDEIARILEPDGRALVSAWSVAADRFDAAEGFDAAVPWEGPDGDTVNRFYHVYDAEEFQADLERSDLETLEFEVSSGNCYATVTVE